MELFTYKPATEQIQNSENQSNILLVLNQIAHRILQKSNIESLSESSLKTKLIQIFQNLEARKKLQKYLKRYLDTQSKRTLSEISKSFQQLLIGLGPAGLSWVYSNCDNSETVAIRRSGKFHSSGVAYLADQKTNSRKRTPESVDPNSLIDPKTENEFLPTPADVVGEDFVEGYLLLELTDLYTAFSILLTGLNFLEGEVKNVTNDENHYSAIADLGDKLAELKAQNILFATGLGDEKKLVETENERVITFAQYQGLSSKQKADISTKEIFVIGSGDSAAVAIESLLAINPQPRITIITSESWDKISDTFGSRSRYGEYNKFLDINSENNLRVIQSRARMISGKILLDNLETPEIPITEDRVVISCIGFESIIPRVLSQIGVEPRVIKNSDNIPIGLELAVSGFGKIIAVGCSAFIYGFHLSAQQIKTLNIINGTGIKLENAFPISAHRASEVEM